MSDRRPTFARARIWLFAAVLAAAVALTSASALASTGAPPTAARDLAQIYFSNTLTRAEIVTLVGRAEHDYRIDEGRVVAVRPNAIDLFERDGTRQTIAIGRQTQIVGLGVARFGVLRGTRVVAVTDNGGPAILVRPSVTARALAKAYFGVGFVRAEVVSYAARTTYDVRIDEGRIVVVSPGSITLQERDGTRQTIAVSGSTLVTQGGAPVDQSALTKGLAAIAIRNADGPAQQVMLVPGVLAAGG